MLLVELGCIAVIAFYAAMQGGRAASLAPRAALIAVSAWMGEETCIRLYGFYGYAPGWHGHLDRVPVLIAVIWPLVVLSAQVLARRAWPRATPARRALATGALVICDAAFIEPVAVRAGLWSWTEPGVFEVPLVGIAGWGFFAAAITYGLDRAERPGRDRGSRALRSAAAVLAAPVATHALLLASWWGALRWLPRPLPDAGAVALAVCASLWVTFEMVRGARSAPPAPPLREMLARLAAAAFFFVLLVLHAHDRPLLVGYALAFAPPYVLVLVRSAQAPVAAEP